MSTGWNCSRSTFGPFHMPFVVLTLALKMILGCAGAAYGTAKSGIGIAGVGTFRPDLIMKVWTRHSPPDKSTHRVSSSL